MWASLVTVTAIAIASNLDNAGVGIAYGVRKIQISWLANLIIALISGIATYLAGVAGDVVTQYVPGKTSTWIGATMMLLVGLWVMTEPWRRRWQSGRSQHNMMARILRDPAEADFDKSKTIGLTEAFVLGIALALNALAGGFDAGIVHIGILVTAWAVAVCSFALLGVTAYLGRRFVPRSMGAFATQIAGLLLIVIGLHQIW
jgi:putative sporulation protein YtaF